MSARDALREILERVRERTLTVEEGTQAISALGPSGDGDGGEMAVYRRKTIDAFLASGRVEACTEPMGVAVVAWNHGWQVARLASQTSGERAVTDELRAAADEAITTLRFQARRGEKSLAVCFRAEAEDMSETAARLEAALAPKAEDRADG